jgi:UDP-galactopyranose mutase
MKIDVLVVGAGFAGAVVAERMAAAGKSVVVLDKRDHIAGNAFDERDAHGVLVHKYGPHIFHTNSTAVADYLSRFTAWRPYEHRVLAKVGDGLYPIPINQDTINRLYNLNLNEAGVAQFLERVREPREKLLTSEDVVLSTVGRDLCDKFFRGYTRKQWGLDLSELSSIVAARIPVRTNRDDRYFTDTFQNMPRDGYTAMFRNMLDHPLIRLELGVDFKTVRNKYQAECLVYTGSIDEYFDHCYGRLPYRSLRFEHEHHAEVNFYQPEAVINYPNGELFTRVTEFKRLTGQAHSGTSIVREYSQSDGEPYYPIPRAENQEAYKRYEELARSERNVFFVGRLAQYRYYNMDQVVASALKVSREIADQVFSTAALC